MTHKYASVIPNLTIPKPKRDLNICRGSCRYEKAGYTPLQLLLRMVTLYGAPTVLPFITQHARYSVLYWVSLLFHTCRFRDTGPHPPFSGLFSAGILPGIAAIRGGNGQIDNSEAGAGAVPIWLFFEFEIAEMFHKIC
jgi:hypothetical protein